MFVTVQEIRTVSPFDHHHREEFGGFPIGGNLHAVGGDRDVASRTEVQKEVPVPVGFEPEGLLDDPAAGFVRRGADEPVLGDREVAAVGGAQRQHPVAPVDQGEFRALGVGGERREVGAAREQRRVERTRRTPYLVGRAALRHPQRGAGRRPQPYPVHALGEVVRPAVDEVVRGHHPGHRARLDGSAEGPQVVLVQHSRAYRRGGSVSGRLVVVRRPVLEDGRRAPVHGMVAAQAPGVRDGDRGGQRRVLRVPFLAASPQRVAQQIHRGRPHVEPDPVVLWSEEITAAPGAETEGALKLERYGVAVLEVSGAAAPEPWGAEGAERPEECAPGPHPVPGPLPMPGPLPVAGERP